MSAEGFQTLDVTQFRRALAKLHNEVSCCRGRVEVKRKGCDDVCVLIGKAELQAMEEALEILSNTADFQAMCKTLSEVVAAASPSFPPIAQA